MADSLKNIVEMFKKQVEIHIFLVKIKNIACAIRFNCYIAPPINII